MLSPFSLTSIPTIRDDLENRAVMLGAYASRAVWNHFTQRTGYTARKVVASHVDWNPFPGGNWLIYRSHLHRSRILSDRVAGLVRRTGRSILLQPHYADSSIVVFVPEHFKETASGTNLIVHFHGHMNDNMGVLEQYRMPQAMVARRNECAPHPAARPISCA